MELVPGGESWSRHRRRDVELPIAMKSLHVALCCHSQTSSPPTWSCALCETQETANLFSNSVISRILRKQTPRVYNLLKLALFKNPAECPACASVCWLPVSVHLSLSLLRDVTWLSQCDHVPIERHSERFHLSAYCKNDCELPGTPLHA